MTSPSNGDAADELRSTLRSDLREAMKARRAVEVEVLRSVLAAIDNAEAVEPGADDASTTSRHIAGAGAGVGSSDVQRRRLSVDDVRAIVSAQMEDLVGAADEYDANGRPEAAHRLRAQATLLRSYLGD